MTIKVKVYDRCKYDRESNKTAEVIYENIKGIEVKEISDDEMYENGYDEVDEYKEYCIITLADGDTSTFRNSHCDVFIQ